MANTIVLSGGIISLTAIDTDWLFSATVGLTGRINVHSIELVPAATADHCVIKDGSAAGATIFDMKCIAITANYAPYIKYFPPSPGLKPFLDVSDGAYNAAAKVIITLGQ